MLWLLVTADVVRSSPSIAILMMGVIHSSETSVLTKAKWHNIPEVGILLCFFEIHTYFCLL
jgi:hypothetical protein